MSDICGSHYVSVGQYKRQQRQAIYSYNYSVDTGKLPEVSI